MRNAINFIIESFLLIKDSFIYLFLEIKEQFLKIIFFLLTQLNKINKKHKTTLDKINKYQHTTAIKKQQVGNPVESIQDIIIVEKKPKSIFTKIKFFIFNTIIIGIFAFSFLIIYILWDLPDYKNIENYQPPISTRLYASDGYLISEIAKEKRTFVPIDEIPQHIKDAFTSAEDKNFYNHSGFDFIGITRAFLNNVKYYIGQNKNIEGASTISQQVAKNFFLSTERSLTRKIREAYLTRKIEGYFSKDYILQLYLNEIYLGRGSYGIAQASLNYFGKSIKDLSIQESAFLAAIPKAPARYDPKYSYNLAKSRRDWVIGRLLEDNKITEEQAKIAIESEIVYKDKVNTLVSSQITNYASEEIRKDLLKKFSSTELYTGGLIIKTTINYAYQQYAYKVLRNGLETYDKQFGYREPVSRSTDNSSSLQLNSKINKKFLWQNILEQNEYVIKNKQIIDPWRFAIIISVNKTSITAGLLTGQIVNILPEDNDWVMPVNLKKDGLDFSKVFKNGDIIFVDITDKGAFIIKQIPEVNGAIVVMNPNNGDVLAMQGGYSFIFSEFNRATQAMRQIGSAFKPFVYLAAINKGVTPSDIVLDAPYVSDDGEKVWRPKNDNGSYSGFITLRYALEYSKNLATIRVATSIGLDVISQVAQSVGMYNNKLENYSQVLGSKETTLLKATTAYGMLANGGKKITPNLVNVVQDSEGRVVYKKDNRSCTNCSNIEFKNQKTPIIEDERQQVIDPQDNFIIVHMLQGVVQRGTGRRAFIQGYDIGGKTGTTNEVKDAWFFAFTPDLVVGVYFGYDNPKPLEASGASAIAAPIFKNFMLNVLGDYKNQPFRTPNGINMRFVDYKTGKAVSNGGSGVILEAFKENQSVQTNIIINNQGTENESLGEGGDDGVLY
jgi:penicillin-binding protein 1A